MSSLAAHGDRTATVSDQLRTDPAFQAFWILRVGFTVAPILFGLDKFAEVMTDWDGYLAPSIDKLVPGTAHQAMLAVGAVEVIAGLLVAVLPRIGGYVVAAWLAGIIVNLLLIGGYYDIALRDFGLLVGALALARLAPPVTLSALPCPGAGHRTHDHAHPDPARPGHAAGTPAPGPGPDRSGRCASTGVKDPAYPDTRYVADLVTSGVVNTMPGATLRAMADHGVLRGDTAIPGYHDAAEVMAALAEIGVDHDDAVDKLERDGLATFQASWAALAEIRAVPASRPPSGSLLRR